MYDRYYTFSRKSFSMLTSSWWTISPIFNTSETYLIFVVYSRVKNMGFSFLILYQKPQQMTILWTHTGSSKICSAYYGCDIKYVPPLLCLHLHSLMQWRYHHILEALEEKHVCHNKQERFRLSDQSLRLLILTKRYFDIDAIISSPWTISLNGGSKTFQMWGKPPQ